MGPTPTELSQKLSGPASKETTGTLGLRASLWVCGPHSHTGPPALRRACSWLHALSCHVDPLPTFGGRASPFHYTAGLQICSQSCPAKGCQAKSGPGACSPGTQTQQEVSPADHALAALLPQPSLSSALSTSDVQEGAISGTETFLATESNVQKSKCPASPAPAIIQLTFNARPPGAARTGSHWQ